MSSFANIHSSKCHMQKNISVLRGRKDFRKTSYGVNVETHEQMSHRGLPREVVATEMHKRLDKLEGNDKTSFAIIMANTNSSVHIRESKNKTDMKNTDTQDDSSGDKYSESYWAEIM